MRVAAALTVALLGLGACGLPGHTEPTFLEGARDSEPIPGLPGQPPGPEGVDSATGLVNRYLEAAAGANSVGGDRPNAYAAASTRVQSFFVETLKEQWSAPRELTVVRPVAPVAPPTPTGSNEWNVHLTLRRLGTLGPNGYLIPSATGETLEVDFGVVRTSGQYRLSKAPTNLLLLSDEGLRDWYRRHTIYFWETQLDPPKLVGDLRYLPNEIASAKQPDEIVRWLRNGPSPGMQPVLQELPDEIEVKDTPVVERDRVIVNLTSRAATLAATDSSTLSRLALQLRWSIPGGLPVELRIQGSQSNVSSDLSPQDLAVPSGDSTDPDRFAVVGGRAVPVRPVNAGPSPLDLPAVLNDPNVNSDVQSAALTQRKDSAALVRTERVNGRPFQRLWLGMRTGSSQQQSTVYRPTDVIGTALSRPVWIYRPDVRALVVRDGSLRSVSLGSMGQTGTYVPSVEVTVQSRGALPGGISAFAVSPDARRIALIVAEQLYVAPLLYLADQLVIGDVQTVVTDLLTQQAVAWGSDVELVVGGTGQKGSSTSIVKIAVDGTRQEPESTGIDPLPVVRLVTRPAGPRGLSAPLIMFESSGTAWAVFTGGPSELEVAGPAPTTGATQSRPSAPFYPD